MNFWRIHHASRHYRVYRPPLPPVHFEHCFDLFSRLGWLQPNREPSLEEASGRMKDPISVRAFLAAVRSLPADPSLDNSWVWYRAQKEQWVGWLSEYEGEGAYGRQTAIKRDHRWAFNHIVNPRMLLENEARTRPVGLMDWGTKFD